MAASTSSTDEYVTKPKPLDLFVLGSLITLKRKGDVHYALFLQGGVNASHHPGM